MNTDRSNLLPIGKASEYLGVSRATLRRWNKSGKFRATFVSPGKRLYYWVVDLEKQTKGIIKSAFDWASSGNSLAPPSDWYCPTSDIFKTRLERFAQDLMEKDSITASLIASAAGEIGNNSYDHNLGNWPDIPGSLFAYDLGKRIVVLADRGLGILATLKRIEPGLSSDKEALEAAFTKIITGRAPEHRGNGLKYVRQAMKMARANLEFQSGNACLELSKKNKGLEIIEANEPIRGCFAVIKF